MTKRIYLLLANIFLFATISIAASNRFTLVIDAGHGRHDAGALGATSKEKDINLNVALAFGRYVERNCPDVKVIYTRKTDVFVPLNVRADIANKIKADLFMSIHTNALPGGKIARGVETYTLGMARAKSNLDVAKRENSVILVEDDYKQHYAGFDPNSSESYIMFEFMQDKYMEKSVELAKQVQSQVCSSTSHADKGVHQAGFLVLRCTSMPSCLIELGFITTPDEEAYLNSDVGIDALGHGIYRAFVNYKSGHNGKVTMPFKADEDQADIPNIVENKPDEDGVMKESPVPVVVQKDNGTDEKPVFKVQIVASNRSLREGSQQFKGETNIDNYQEDNMFKYTIGASADYNEIYRLRKTLLGKFPEAFIVAFKDGNRMNINQAIAEFKSNRNKK